VVLGVARRCSRGIHLIPNEDTARLLIMVRILKERIISGLSLFKQLEERAIAKNQSSRITFRPDSPFAGRNRVEPSAIQRLDDSR
jgi:hypothetical protein